MLIICTNVLYNLIVVEIKSIQFDRARSYVLIKLQRSFCNSHYPLCRCENVRYAPINYIIILDDSVYMKEDWT